MTVCVAAICAHTMVMGMSDRMLTAGDLQFQPSSSKIWRLTNSIVMMSAGDIGLQSEIYGGVRKFIAGKLAAEPERWLQVEEVANQYRATYFNIKSQRSEQAILGSLGLTRETFIANQRTMEPTLVSNLASELLAYGMPGVAAIIAGNSPLETGNPEVAVPHIFTIENGDILCADKVGFACVGVGAWHANSTLMLAGHTPGTSAVKALLNIYSAKKRAEVAPGVGSDTDTFLVTNALGSCDELRDDLMARVAEIYKRNLVRNARALKKAEDSLHAYIERFTTKQPPEPQTADSTKP